MSNRTTPSNVWKPPPSEGTTSPQRALRWQANASDAPDDKSAKVGRQASGGDDDTRSEKSASTNRTSGTASTTRTGKSSSKSSRRRGKEKKEAKDEGPKEPGELDWYGDPLKPGIEGSLGPGGSLHSWTAKGKPRAGMCNPPMNPAIRAALVADLNAWGVEPIVKTKKEKEKQKQQEEGGAEKAATRKKIIIPPVRRASVAQDLLGDSVTDLSATQPAGQWFGAGHTSAGSSRMSSPALTGNMRRSVSVPSGGRSTGTRGSSFDLVRKKKKRCESTWELGDLTQEGKPKKHGLDTAPEGEIQWRRRALKLQSREHGFILEKADVEELGHLSMYHNWFSRGPLQHTVSAPVVHPVHPSKQLRAIGSGLVSTLRDIGSDMGQHSEPWSHHSLSDETLEVELNPYRNMPRAPPVDLSQMPPSTERLMEMAHSVMHSTPHALQLMCQQAGISVHTGARLPADQMEFMGSPSQFEDDPLFSSRPGATPRTSTGKPLPVPYWGRNGNAPQLREAPELRQARAAAEAAR